MRLDLPRSARPIHDYTTDAHLTAAHLQHVSDIPTVLAAFSLFLSRHRHSICRLSIYAKYV